MQRTAFKNEVIKNLLERVKGQRKVPKGAYLSSGKFKIVDQGEGFINGYTDDEALLYKGPMPVVVFGDHTCRLKFLKHPFCLGADGTQLMFTKRLDQTYFYYALKGLNFKISAYQRHYKLIKEKSILYPEDKEAQARIASVLSAYDDLIENNEKRIKRLEEMAQFLYTEWFVKFKFPGHEKVKMVDSGTEYGTIPEGWDVKNVEGLIKRIPVGKKYENKSVFETGKVPVLDQGKSGFIGYHNDEPGVKASIENPIIVFANHTCYQNIIVYPFSVIQNVLPFIPNDDRDVFWLHWATKDLIKFNDYKGHWPEFMSKKLIVPPVDTTKKFGQLVGKNVTMKYELETKNRNLSKTRDLLIPQLVTGRRELK